jgi:hypothetical protein
MALDTSKNRNGHSCGSEEKMALLTEDVFWG